MCTSFGYLSLLARIDFATIVCRRKGGNRCAMRYSTLAAYPFKTIYMRFHGVSTLVISFFLICTTRRWDRGSVWGHTLFLSELIFFSIHAKTHFARPWRPSFDSRCEPCIVPKKIVNVFCLPTKIL